MVTCLSWAFFSVLVMAVEAFWVKIVSISLIHLFFISRRRLLVVAWRIVMLIFSSKLCPVLWEKCLYNGKFVFLLWSLLFPVV